MFLSKCHVVLCLYQNRVTLPINLKYCEMIPYSVPAFHRSLEKAFCSDGLRKRKTNILPIILFICRNYR